MDVDGVSGMRHGRQFELGASSVHTRLKLVGIDDLRYLCS